MRPPKLEPALLLSALLLGSFSCKGETSVTDEAPPPTAQGSEGDGAPANNEASTPALDMPPMAELFTRGLSKPGPYDEPKTSPGFSKDVRHHVVLELDRPLVEIERISMFSPARTMTLRSLSEKLSTAATDPNVAGLLLRVGDLGLDMATAQELREMLVAFKGDEERSVICHTEGVSNGTYHALTACDRLALAPLGNVMITGAVATPVHVKGLLDRLGIAADFLHIGAFKGAAEPLTRDKPSAEMLETLQAIVDESYETLVDGIVEGRELEQDAVVAAIDEALFVGEEAREAGLVDDVAPWESLRDETTKAGGWRRADADENPLAGFGALQRFLGLLPPDRPTQPHVALVYAVGNIVDGKGDGILKAREHIASRTLVPALRALASDDQVKAVVLRIDSGGGSALASEQIWEAADALAKRKPLVVSMGAVAASGGYYIASAANKIYARDNTLTGSIGVVGGKLVFGDALEKLGVKTYAVKRGERAMLWSAVDPWTPGEREVVRAMMEATYEKFLSRVASGRRMDRDRVHAIAQGRVWTGLAAKEHGLVDELGGLEAALAEAHRMAKLDPGQKLEVYPPEPTLRDFVSMGLGNVQTSTDRTFAELAIAAASMLGAPHAQQVENILDALFDLRDTRLWAMSWIRPPR